MRNSAPCDPGHAMPLVPENEMQGPALKHTARRAIFLDRDGVINEKLPEDRYVTCPSEFCLLPGAAEGLRILQELSYLLIVVTNQRGIARGFMTEEDLRAVHDFMSNSLKRLGVYLDGIYYCPHEKGESCPCRKPEPGMILDAEKHFRTDPGRSYLVGDSDSDMEAAKRAGVQPVRISNDSDDQENMIFSSLLAFANYLKRNETDG